MRTLEEKLASLYNRATAYELAAVHSDGRKLLVCYCRKTGPGLSNALLRTLDAGDRRIDRLANATNTKPEDWKWASARQAKAGEWSVAFTGRTQRDCYCNGELPALS